MHANFPHLKPIVVNPTPQNNVSTASDELLVSFLPLSKAVRPPPPAVCASPNQLYSPMSRRPDQSLVGEEKVSTEDNKYKIG